MVRNDVETFLKKSIFGHFGVILGSFWGHWVIFTRYGAISPKQQLKIAALITTHLQCPLMLKCGSSVAQVWLEWLKFSQKGSKKAPKRLQTSLC